MKFIIINGPNLNLLGLRETDIYGTEKFENYFLSLKKKYNSVDIDFFQSNVEGELINKLQEVGFAYNGIILNPGAYSHTSIAIADALKAITTPAVEVHISNIFNREIHRHTLLTAANCVGCISGLGFSGYELALFYLINNINKIT